MKALVLGAGPAGLAAAQALVEGGAQVTLLEASSSVGGLARSQRVAGHWVDLGPHRLHREASASVRRLLGGAGGLSERPRKGKIHLGARSVDYPLSPVSLLRGLGPYQAARFALGALTASRCAGDRSYAGEARRRVGGPVYDALYAPAAKKIWGRAPEELDGSQAVARVGTRSPRALLGRLVGRGEPGSYLYPSHGANGFAYEAWARELKRRGVSLLDQTAAQQVLHEQGRVRGVRASARGRTFVLPAERVVSTLALPRLLSLLVPALSGVGADELSFRSVVALHVVLGRARLSEQDVHYFPSPSVPFARLTEQAGFGRAPGTPAGETVITLDLYDDAEGPLTHASAEELLQRVWPDLESFGLTPSDVRAVDKRVAHDAYPVMGLGYLAARDRCLDALTAVDGLISTGRAGLFQHVNQHHAIEMGLEAGAVALGPAPITRRWRALARRFESMRVVD
jgi:protoporphyrinogen oxidase